MSDDFYSEVSSQGWFSRIGGAITGALIGIVLFLVSFVVLFINEGWAVDDARGLAEAGGAVVTIPSDKLDPAFEGKLVHTIGKATTEDIVTDDVFGISSPGIRLIRYAEMYQWKEETKKETRNKLGGGQETVTNYSYTKVWHGAPIKSTEFHSNKSDKRDPHNNPDWPEMYMNRDFRAQKVSLGAHTLPVSLVDAIHTAEPLPVPSNTSEKDKFKVVDGQFYRGGSPSDPQVGDIKISYKLVKPTTVSVIAEQSGDSFHPYHPKSAKKEIERLSEGEMTAKQMIETAQAEIQMRTWILRLVGYLLMAAGLFLVMNPLKILAGVLPFLGDLVGFMLGIFAALVAAVLSLITIAIAWLVYRPLLAIAILAVAGFFLVGVIYLITSIIRKRGAKVAQAATKRK